MLIKEVSRRDELSHNKTMPLILSPRYQPTVQWDQAFPCTCPGTKVRRASHPMRGDVRKSAGTKIALELRSHHIDKITRRAHMAVPSPQPVPVQLHQTDDRLVLATPMPGLEP